MSFKLDFLTFSPRGSRGWSSRVINLKNNVTIFYGDNGTGKTPLVSGLSFALGGTVEIPSEIKKHCSKIVVGFKSVDGERFLIERYIDEEFKAYVSKKGSSKRELLTDEKQFADWFLGKLSIDQRTITGRNKNSTTSLYLSTLMPLLYVDQDHGWGTTYYAPMNRRFIKAQEEEMIRTLFALPARHPHTSKKEESAIKERINSLEDHAERLKRNIADEERLIEQEVGETTEQELIDRKKTLMRDLESLQEGADRLQTVSSSFDVDISDNYREIERLNTKKVKLSLEASKYIRVIDGLEEESTMLSDNEKASSVFRNLCRNTGNCGLFKDNEDSYGRRLLFLQDQKKDIELQYDDVQFKIKNIDERIRELEEENSELEKSKSESTEKVQLTDVSSRIKDRIKELSDVDRKLVRFEDLRKVRSQYDETFKKKKEFDGKLLESRPKGKRNQTDVETEVRDLFRENLEKWVGTLRTPNIDHRIPVNKDFSINIGDVKFNNDSEHSGSTRLRIVLAYHAALLETSLETDGNHPGFLIFDTPKQHELNEKDLDAYFKAFRTMIARYPEKIQLILAVKDLPFSPKPEDYIWEPSFDGEDGAKFFGPEDIDTNSP